MKFLTFACAAVMLTVMFATVSAGAEPFTGKVAEVIDGDTFTVMQADKPVEVRLRGVDAPELAQKCGPEAKKFLADLVLSKDVTVDAGAPDKKQKLPAKVTLEDGQVVNELVLDAGMGWFWERDPGADQGLLKHAAKAISAKKGLWADAAPLAPWDFRADSPDADFLSADQPGVPAKDEASKKEDEKKEETPVLAYKGEYVEKEFFPQFKDDPVFQQLGPGWKRDANGKILGVTAKNISSNPIAAMLGFQDGDVIQSVNGNMIDSEDKIMSLVDKLKNEKELKVGIIRNGSPQTMTIPIPPGIF